MLDLQFEEASAVVAPEIGGALVGWTWDGMPMLRQTSAEAIQRGDVRGFACFPLVPFCNRIGNGRFTWAGRTYQLERNFGDHPHAIHGIGWQRPWQVENLSPESVIMTLEHAATGAQATHWPFAFSAAVSYALLGWQLHIALTITNRHDGPAPAGLGLHPYFPRSAVSTLRFKSDSVWLNDADSLAMRHAALPAGWDHTAGLQVGALPLDNCFTGWDGTATLGGMTQLTLHADHMFRNLQVYTPPGQDFFCIEPVSHTPDAINHLEAPEGQGMRVLQPGEMMIGTATIMVQEPYEHLMPRMRH